MLPLWAGCRGWQGDTYLRHFAPAKRARQEASFQFATPPSPWAPVRGVKDVQVAWVNPSLGGVIAIHGQCDEQGDSSLVQYTDHLSMDWTDWEVRSQSDGRLVGRAALWTEVDAQLDGVKRRNLFIVTKKNGCLFDLSYSARPEVFAQGQGAFERVVQGFRFPLEAK